MMNIVIAGGTGMIGRALTVLLVNEGYSVTVLTRSKSSNPHQSGLKYVNWGDDNDNWFHAVDGADGIVNLAGENIGSGRWTNDKKNKILESRVTAGKLLTEAVIKANIKPKIFIQSSAIGIYGTSSHNVFTEKSSTGSDYLSGVAKIWEDSSKPVEDMGIKRAVIRTGVVLDPKEGALARMLLPFRLFVGGPIGSGRQWLSWIHLQDEVAAIKFLIEKQLSGVFNLTSPNPVQNAEMGRQIARVLNRPYWMPVPGFALKSILGEMSVLVLEGQKVLPESLLTAGFTFKYPDLPDALKNILGK